MIQTATKESIDAVKEEEMKAGLMQRWWVQFTKGISTMQRRIYSKVNLHAAIEQRKAKLKAADDGKTLIARDLYDMMADVDGDNTKVMFKPAPDLKQADQAAVQVIMDLLEDGLTVQEIIILANKPASEFTEHVGAEDDLQFLQFYQLAKGNPNFDQSKLDEQAANRLIGYKNTKEVFVPQPSQTSDIEASRQQQLEWTTMLGGEGVQVSQRDPHMQHFQTIVPLVANHMKIASGMPPLQVPKDLLNALKIGMTHSEAHIQAMMQQGANKRQLKPQILQQKDLEKMYQHLLQSVQQAEMQAAQMQMMQQQQAGIAGIGGGVGGGAGPQPQPAMGPSGLPLGIGAPQRPPGMNGAPPPGGSPGLAQTMAGG